MAKQLFALFLVFVMTTLQLYADQPTYDQKQANEALNAINSGNLSHAMELVKGGLPATAKGAYGMSLLLAAAQQGEGDMVRFLIEQGADPNEPILYGQSAMHMALDHPSMLKGMVDLGGNINLANKNAETLLMTAAMGSKPQTVRILLDLGADPKLRDRKGRNALFHVMSNKASYVDEIFVMLVERGAETHVIDQEGTTLLMEAAAWGRDHLIEVYNLNADVPWVKNNKGESVLDMLAGGGKGRQRVADMLLARNPPADLLQHALETTLKSGEYWMTEKMINAGARVEDAQLLFLAINGGSWDSLRQLLVAGLDPNVLSAVSHKTPLQTAVAESKMELVRLLLQYGADIGTLEGEDLLYGNVFDDEDKRDLVRLLVDAGLDPELKIYDEKLSEYLESHGEGTFADLFTHTRKDGCSASTIPLANEQLAEKRDEFIGTWRQQVEEGVDLILTSDGQAQRKIEMFGIQKRELGTWVLKGSHLGLYMISKGESSSQHLGVHCIAKDRMILGNGSEALYFRKLDERAVIAQADPGADEGLGPVGDSLTDQQAIKLIARIGCYSKGYTNDAERTAALMKYVKPSGIEDQEVLMKKLGPYLQDESFQANHFMEVMSEMLICRESL